MLNGGEHLNHFVDNVSDHDYGVALHNANGKIYHLRILLK